MEEGFQGRFQLVLMSYRLLTAAAATVAVAEAVDAGAVSGRCW